MLGNFDNEIVLFVVDSGVGNQKSRINRRQIALLKFDVDDRSQYLCYFAYVFSHQKTSKFYLFFAAGCRG